MLDYLERSGAQYDFSALREVISGGSALPVSVHPSLSGTAGHQPGASLRNDRGRPPSLPTICRKSGLDSLSAAEKDRLAGKQGLLVAGLEMKLVDEAGQELPWDGEQRGELLFRGPWLAAEYYQDDRTAETFRAGWYHSGDIAAIDPEGYVQIATGCGIW